MFKLQVGSFEQCHSVPLENKCAKGFVCVLENSLSVL